MEEKWYRVVWHRDGLHWIYEVKHCTLDKIKESVEHYNAHKCLDEVYTFEEDK